MIKDNIIYFGYGDILVYNGFCNLKFRYIDSRYPIGFDTTGIPDTITEISHITIYFHTVISLNTFISKLKDVLIDGVRTFEYNGYIFDFTNYNEASVNVCINQANTLLHYLLIPTAS